VTSFYRLLSSKSREPRIVRRAPLLVAALAFAFGVAAFSGTARAVEREWHAGIGGGLASTSIGDQWAGFGFGAHVAYGLNDAFNALLQLDANRFGAAGTWSLDAAAGAAYTLDITEWVPYGGVLLGVNRFTGASSATGLSAQIALGLDYRIERNWALGIQLRYHSIWAADPIGRVDQTTTFLRAEYVWGF
jgi:hypothetical protein